MSLKYPDPRDWYWWVGGDEARAFSSARQDYVPADDPALAAWCGDDRRPTRIDDEASLAAVLGAYDLHLSPAAALAAYAGARRYALETGGIVVNGLAVATDDRSKTMLLGARVAAAADPAFATTWFGLDGTRATLDAASVIAVSDAVLAHVAACFTAFGAVSAGIAAGTITTRDEVDAAFAGA